MRNPLQTQTQRLRKKEHLTRQIIESALKDYGCYWRPLLDRGIPSDEASILKEARNKVKRAKVWGLKNNYPNITTVEERWDHDDWFRSEQKQLGWTREDMVEQTELSHKRLPQQPLPAHVVKQNVAGRFKLSSTRSDSKPLKDIPGFQKELKKNPGTTGFLAARKRKGDDEHTINQKHPARGNSAASSTYEPSYQDYHNSSAESSTYTRRTKTPEWHPSNKWQETSWEPIGWKSKRESYYIEEHNSYLAHREKEQYEYEENSNWYSNSRSSSSNAKCKGKPNASTPPWRKGDIRSEKHTWCTANRWQQSRAGADPSTAAAAAAATASAEQIDSSSDSEVDEAYAEAAAAASAATAAAQFAATAAAAAAATASAVATDATKARATAITAANAAKAAVTRAQKDEDKHWKSLGKGNEKKSHKATKSSRFDTHCLRVPP